MNATKYYFAHSMRIYNTHEESTIHTTLKALGYDILCPNKDVGELGSLNPYLKIVKSCKGVIAHEYKGFVGRGVYEELKTALSLNLPCFAIRGKELVKVTKVVVHDSTDWKVKYGKILTK